MRLKLLIAFSGLTGASCLAQAPAMPATQTPTQTQTAPTAPAPVPAQSAPMMPAPATQATPAQTLPAYGQQPAAPATVPVQTFPSMPAPTPQAAPAGSLPAYGQQPIRPNTAPTPTPSAAPVVQPATPTQANPYTAYVPYGVPDEDRHPQTLGSAYIPVDSWIYPAMTRLYSLGYVRTMFLSMRPWTRQSVLHMLDESDDDIRDSDDEQAKEIVVAVRKRLSSESVDAAGQRSTVYGTDSVYARAMGIHDQSLRDSYHLGQTIANDYGRPYQPGFNSIIGASTIAESGRFSLYVRGEYQHSPSGPGYSPALVQILANNVDQVGYDQNSLGARFLYPQGTIQAENPFRLVEATLSFHVAGHEISGGKSDAWLGPAQGGAMAWSNNAENIYSFRINRVEPLHIPYLSALLGPVRYDFFYGSLKGHSAPNHPYVHAEMFSFRPTDNFEFTFERTQEFGGAGHSPVTLHTFLKGFFDINDTSPEVKLSRADPGARFSDFSASYRMPFVRKYLTFYVDSFVHDDVTPISAPRRAAYRTGLYLSQIPGLRRLDLRVEGASTDPKVSRSSNGEFIYYESQQRQAYTNQGLMFGDSIGREGKGGNAWLTYHLTGNQYIQASYLNKKNDKDFAGGTTQNQFKAQVVKRFLHDNLELDAWVQYERWKAPLYQAGQRSDTTTAVQITYFPKLKSKAIY